MILSLAGSASGMVATPQRASLCSSNGGSLDTAASMVLLHAVCCSADGHAAWVACMTGARAGHWHSRSAVGRTRSPMPLGAWWGMHRGSVQQKDGSSQSALHVEQSCTKVRMQAYSLLHRAMECGQKPLPQTWHQIWSAAYSMSFPAPPWSVTVVPCKYSEPQASPLGNIWVFMGQPADITRGVSLVVRLCILRIERMGSEKQKQSPAPRLHVIDNAP